jgi:hypothetical protein
VLYHSAIVYNPRVWTAVSIQVVADPRLASAFHEVWVVAAPGAVGWCDRRSGTVALAGPGGVGQLRRGVGHAARLVAAGRDPDGAGWVVGAGWWRR